MSGFNQTLIDKEPYWRTAIFYQIGPELMRLAKNPTCNFILRDFVGLIVNYLVSGHSRSFRGLYLILKRYLIHGTITLEDLHFRVEVQHYFSLPDEDFVCFTVRTFIFSYASLDLKEKKAFQAGLPFPAIKNKGGGLRSYHRIDDWYYLLEEEKAREKK